MNQLLIILLFNLPHIISAAYITIDNQTDDTIKVTAKSGILKKQQPITDPATGITTIKPDIVDYWDNLRTIIPAKSQGHLEHSYNIENINIDTQKSISDSAHGKKNGVFNSGTIIVKRRKNKYFIEHIRE